MWLLHFFSDSFIQFIAHAVLVAGILGCALTFGLLNRLLIALPVLAPYYQALRAVSVVFLVCGIYLQGGYAAEIAWRERVREMESRVAAAEQAAQDATAKLDARGQQKVQAIKQKAVVVKQYISREVSKYDNTCVIPLTVVRAHNAAARNEELK